MIYPHPPNPPYPLPEPSFNGYNSQLKKLWKAGKLPQVKYGFYGDKLTLNNCSVEHLKPVSKKGKTESSNIVLASKLKNNNRGDKPLEMFLNLKSMTKYLEQFKNIIVDGFNGNEYIASILETVGKVLKKGE